MDEQARQTAFMSALVTEHFVLQSVASTTVSEAGSRASLYVFSLSSSLVAMGFTAETDAFPTLVAAVLPALFVLGWFTVVRLVDTSVGSYRVQEAIAHIRGFYRQLTPEAPYYFPVWHASDEEAAEALAMLGTTPRRSVVLFTTAGMVAAINSLVGGVGVALLTNEVLGHGSDVPAVVAGCGFGVACLAVASIYQLRRYTATAAEETRRWAADDPGAGPVQDRQRAGEA